MPGRARGIPSRCPWGSRAGASGRGASGTWAPGSGCSREAAEQFEPLLAKVFLALARTCCPAHSVPTPGTRPAPDTLITAGRAAWPPQGSVQAHAPHRGRDTCPGHPGPELRLPSPVPCGGWRVACPTGACAHTRPLQPGRAPQAPPAGPAGEACPPRPRGLAAGSGLACGRSAHLGGRAGAWRRLRGSVCLRPWRACSPVLWPWCLSSASRARAAGSRTRRAKPSH